MGSSRIFFSWKNHSQGFYCESSLWEESKSSCFSLCVSLGKELRKYSHLAANGPFIHELTSFSAKHFLQNVFLANKSAIELLI
jgi:hypothetical protein